MPRQDDPDINGDRLLYRRIPPKADRVQWDGNQPTATSQNFRDREDELSAFLAAECSLAAVLVGLDGYGVVQFTAGKVRELFGAAIIICRDTAEPDNGHVLICGRITNGMSTKFKSIVTWVPGYLPRRPPPEA